MRDPGAADAPKFKDYILPLVFFKRISDVFDDKLAGFITEHGDKTLAREIVEDDHLAALAENRRSMAGCYVPQAYNWAAIRNHPADGSLGEFVIEAMRATAEANPDLPGVFDVRDRCGRVPRLGDAGKAEPRGDARRGAGG